ncbi:Hypothetical protein NTJ_07180 [Nesidiocoris tenuis]|uniref:Tudor domain-containing protein n=1 Tax=Nesidiocoris tenuis TaxID=355587 RepID=A0ABN7AQ74_9HEMI|nr:Hypothetical protein NTJ_07180 [Nesidiocoris tenuis]
MSQNEGLSWAAGLESSRPLNGKTVDPIDGSGDTKSAGTPSLSLSIPKKLDGSQEAQEELPNGHNGESSGVDASEPMDDGDVSNSLDSPKETKDSDGKDPENPVSDAAAKDTEVKKDPIPEKKIIVDESQDLFETRGEDKNDPSKSNENTVMEESQNSFSLNVTESQFFGPADNDDLSNDASSEKKEEEKVENETKEVHDKEDEEKEENEVAEDKPDVPSESAEPKAEEEESAKDTEEDVQTAATSPANPSPDPSAPCTCEPSCHYRVHTVSQRLNTVCQQLGDFIKLKRRVENPDLANLLSLLTGIESIVENKPEAMSEPEPEGIFYASNAADRKKKSESRAKFETPTPQKRAEKKSRETATPKPPERVVDFKDIKGLAVFAKWPNSGWYYPGVVEGLLPVDWKENTNVTVTFYDGLVREMKNINILPANLIPPGVILCDLDDETEMIVDSIKSLDDNNVEFTMALKDDAGTKVDASFNKLAIKAIHMKSIKTLLEPSADVAPRKMHMVSLDNLVSGRRIRIGTNKDETDELLDSPRRGSRKSVRKGGESTAAEDEPMEDEESTPASSSRRKRSAAAEATPLKSNRKRPRQQ